MRRTFDDLYLEGGRAKKEEEEKGSMRRRRWRWRCWENVHLFRCSHRRGSLAEETTLETSLLRVKGGNASIELRGRRRRVAEAIWWLFHCKWNKYRHCNGNTWCIFCASCAINCHPDSFCAANGSSIDKQKDVLRVEGDLFRRMVDKSNKLLWTFAWQRCLSKHSCLSGQSKFLFMWPTFFATTLCRTRDSASLAAVQFVSIFYCPPLVLRVESSVYFGWTGGTWMEKTSWYLPPLMVTWISLCSWMEGSWIDLLTEEDVSSCWPGQNSASSHAWSIRRCINEVFTCPFLLTTSHQCSAPGNLPAVVTMVKEKTFQSTEIWTHFLCARVPYEWRLLVIDEGTHVISGVIGLYFISNCLSIKFTSPNSRIELRKVECVDHQSEWLIRQEGPFGQQRRLSLSHSFHQLPLQMDQFFHIHKLNKRKAHSWEKKPMFAQTSRHTKIFLVLLSPETYYGLAKSVLGPAENNEKRTINKRNMTRAK